MNLLPRGAAAEARAQRHLKGRGLKLLERNWRCPGGELDMVMREGATLAAHPEHASLPVRFDVVALDGEGKLEWLQAAFED
jgi:putative endonuclease